MQGDESWKKAEWFVISNIIYKMYREVKNMDFRAIQTPVQILAMPLDNYVTWVGTSLVAQWLRICLPIQGTRV